MQHTAFNYYSSNIQLITNELKLINKRIKLVSALRLATFLLSTLSVYLFTVTATHFISPFIFVIAIISLFTLIKYHLNLNKKKEITEKLLEINKNELEYLTHNYTQFDEGSEYIDYSHPYSSDLNLFGHASLFQYLNRTVTFFGKKELATWLTKPSISVDEIKQRQETCHELSEKTTWRERFQATGSIVKNTPNDFDSIFAWLNEPSVFSHKKWLKKFLVIMPILSFASLIIGLLTSIYAIAETLFTLQFVTVLIYSKLINITHEKLSQKNAVLLSYSDLLHLIEKESFQSELLQNAKNVLFKGNDSASQQLKKLSHIVNAFDRRMNIIATFFLNTLYMADLWSMVKLEKWREKNKLHINEWFNALAQFDAHSSLACYAFNNNKFIYPNLNADKYEFIATEMGHPLIPTNKRVCNNFSINHESNFIILTGANMAGKSTFLRTIGVNMILGMCGAPVCAKQLTFKPLPVMTSISVKDSLFDNESYFYAELKRLKMIIDELNNGTQIFIILDEILKGTNSNDKMAGSKMLLQKLINYKSAGIIATHDISLGELELTYPENIKNHSFEVELDNDRLYYDYKLHNGVCKNLNASFLMKKMGIIY